MPPEETQEPSAAAQPRADGGKVLAVDDEQPIREMLEAILASAGIETLTAESGEKALELISPEIGLLLTDLKMPGMSGIDLVKAVRGKGWNGKVIILTGFPDKDSVLGASQLGVVEYLTKPFDRVKLLDRVEEALHLDKSLVEITADGELRECLLDRQRSVPMFMPGEVEISIQDLQDLAMTGPGLLEQGAVVPARDYFAVNDMSKIPDLSGREPTIKSDQPIDPQEIRAICRIANDAYGGLVSADKNPAHGICLQRNPALGEHMSAGQRLVPEVIAARLKFNPMCSHVLNASKPSAMEPVFQAMADTWRHHEVIYMLHQIKANGNQRLQGHILATAFFAILHAEQSLQAGFPDLTPEEKSLVLAVAGVCGALHDLGLSSMPGDVEFGSKDYLHAWQSHTAVAFKAARNTNLYSEAKFVIRDHHRPLFMRRSRYDCFTRIVQLASDMDNMVQGQGVVLEGRGPVMVREPQVLDEACRTLLFRARQGVYSEDDADFMLRGCRFDALADYYNRLREIGQRACGNIILSPSEINPITVLCRGGLKAAAQFRHEIYCQGCTPTQSHSYRGSFYSRCLFGHDEIVGLNQEIKHLGSRQEQEEEAENQVAEEEPPDKKAAAAGKGEQTADGGQGGREKPDNAEQDGGEKRDDKQEQDGQAADDAEKPAGDGQESKED